MDELDEKNCNGICTSYNEVLAKVIQLSETNKPLRSDHYKAIIEKAKKESSIVYRDAPMMSPEGGTIVVYDCRIVEAWKNLPDSEKRKSCRCDGYRWSRMKGAKALSNGLYRCYNFLYDRDCKAGSDVFVRYEFTLCTEPAGLILFHYIGNHEIARQVSATAPHGNARKTTQPYTRTLPATRLDIRRSLVLTGSADKTFKALKEHTCASGKEAIILPRNEEQVRYELNAMQRSMRVSDESGSLYSHVPMTSLEFQTKLVDRLSIIPADQRGEVRAKLEHELDLLFAQKIAAEIEEVFDESTRESIMERLLAMVTP